MNCFDSGEVRELVGSYILSKLNLSLIKKVGLYRDDGLGVFRNLSGPEIERKRKEIIKVFKDCGLSIATKT